MTSNEKCNAIEHDADKCNVRYSWIAFGVFEKDCNIEPDEHGWCYSNPDAAYNKRRSVFY